VIGLLILGLFVALGIAVILGWTADSRDDEQKLWPLERTRPDTPTRATAWHDCSLPDARRHAALQRACDPIARPTTRRSP
jgi:hypothetical protein